MKKITITTACLLAVAGAAFAQGNVNWNTLSAAAVTFQTNTTTYFGGAAVPGGNGTIGAAGGSASQGTGFYYELLIGSVYTGSVASAPTTIPGLASWADSGLEATNSNTAGRITTINPNAGATVTQLSQTVSNNIIIVGWSANLGSTWSVALTDLETLNWSGNAFLGVTSIGYIEGASPSTSPGTSVVGTAANANGTGLPIDSLLTQLYLVPTPEPTTLALAALGGASLLLLRRKK